ncbi:dihydrolipoyllysine-residue acetyltransferase [Chiayiivirga flava]|uniref:Dihydrolipoamide acetyltransferase component of pyruvate dehydrogenase complex n=1 Tax=Chiayiivirga flava TaxID=659595 RepID=A0A7W8D7V1_9GAMM|nr:dihydrolipoyllysine-residue acetyltransferase [Chiayiivirga flava]MBB5209202.1 pyruvate dehydrogenase E2 component (dihydrolipoamide acetyltransferase) [Chiayiivirga flava]
MAVKEARVPDIGDYTDVPVIEVLVAVGDTVSKDQGLVTLESDKATLEVPAPFAGVVKELKVKLGDTLSEGSVVAMIEEAGGDAAASETPKPAAPVPEKAPAKTAEKVEAAAQADKPVDAPKPATPPAAPAATPAPAQQNAAAASSRNLSDSAGVDPEAAGPRTPPVTFDADAVRPDKVPHASPAVRLFARELGVDLAKVSGSARAGRISKEDVQNFVKSALAGGGAPGAPAAAAGGGGGLNLLPWPKVDFAKFGEVETTPLSRIKKISGANLARNWAMIPHVTQHDDADITEMEAFRKKLGEEQKDVKVTPLVFLIKAVVAGLKKFPDFNASLDATGENLVRKKYFHIGIAVDTPDGLVVPVIRDCDRKGLLELATELGEVSKKARDKKLGPADMSGGCFSISSLGGIGGTGFTPIINAPEVAILGVSKSSMKPVWNGKEFDARLILPLSLSYDHRVIDGAQAARFTAYLAQVLGDLRRILL